MKDATCTATKGANGAPNPQKSFVQGAWSAASRLHISAENVTTLARFSGAEGDHTNAKRLKSAPLRSRSGVTGPQKAGFGWE
jgi:hypothetical protein